MTTILLIKIKTEIETRGPYWSQCYSNHLSRRQGCSEEPKCIQVLRPRPYQPRLLREGADILDKPLSVVFFSVPLTSAIFLHFGRAVRSHQYVKKTINLLPRIIVL